MAQEKEDFLGRWSRLKREQAKEAEVARQPADAGKPPELPPVDQLTSESEFSGFMHPQVKDALRRVALKKLFSDPHFNTPDPFEPFSGDWTVGETISDEMMGKLNQARTLVFSPEEKARALAADEAQAEEEAYAEDARRQEAKDDEPRRQDT